MTITKPVLAAVGVGIAVLGLSACGGSSSGSATSSAASSPAAASPSDSQSMVGGTTTCDETTMAKAVADYAAAEGIEAEIGERGFVCADGWALVHMAVTGSGGAVIEQNLALQAEGQFWVPQDPAKICDDPASIPAEIEPDICLPQ